MMFASKTPRELAEHPDDSEAERDLTDAEWIAEGMPWPTQHNEPNPILAGNLREAVALDAQESPPILDLSSTARYILDATYDEASFEECFTPEQIDHARRVLTRLAALS